ncbi:pyrroloquinoline-quinone glucose dehydrogenase [Aliidiomarina minuta]|uniref:Pyrroloquinoline-quinone glucose dehydrogenase n=1 Tax=Aliidiomarina minuta TaxID=880057 RepID=A0A432W628_9GAMM|nr:PQQ-dependent sugar dehydrogenase [Aliidiomarina minuta]RUO25492.1 pyrroloquinoline-quinone glucose dehydrogenase [Aliidiomarina minuta]
MKRFLLCSVLSGLAITPALADPGDRVRVAESVVSSGIESEKAHFRVVQVVEALEHPWAMAWLPDGRMLITERGGNLVLAGPDDVTSIGGLPEIDAEEDQLSAPDGGNQGGLMDLVLHPDYDQNGWIYFTYSSPGDDDGVAEEDRGTGTALARARLSDDGSELVDLETIYAQTPRHVPGRHYGSRIVFPDDGSVIFSIGDRGLRWPSQDLTDPGGSMIRLYESGGAHEENPFVRQAPGNLRPEIYSYGHRNNQSMALHPDTGELWTAEHGPYGGDILHRVEKGKNYGWPQVAFGVEYSTKEKIGIGESAPGVQAPLHVWEDSMAPSGMAFYTAAHFPGWQNSLFVGSLYREELHRLEITDGEVTHREELLDETVGRIRDVRQGPDGYLYLLTDEGEAGVYRLEPVE